MKSFSSLALAAGVSAISEHDLHFLNHIATHGNTYATLEEYTFRQGIWADLDAFIQAENAEGHSYTVGHNKFSTWTAEEFKGMMGYVPSSVVYTQPDQVVHHEAVDPLTLASSVDWRTSSPVAVNPIQDQGQCGSCWAFAATAADEGIDAITNGTLRKFSEQQVVSCTQLCFGCGGGNAIVVFNHFAKNNQIYLESAWPYTSGTTTQTGTCTPPSSSPSNFKTTGAVVPVQQNSDALKAMVAQQPTAVAIQADQRVFQSYQSGVFTSTKCGTSLDHAVSLVGYGTEGGQEYYTLRNSWGSSWGEAGYMKILNNGNGAGICGVQMDTNAPTM